MTPPRPAPPTAPCPWPARRAPGPGPAGARRGIALALGLLAASLSGCTGAGAQRRGPDGRAIDPADPAGRSGASGSDAGRTPSAMQAQEDRFFRIDALVAQWDAAQQAGQDEQADGLALKIGEETDADFATIQTAAGGSLGLRAQHLAVKALGFSKNPAATALLVARLNSDDPQLVGNALIGLKLRADPSTSLPPIIRLLRSNVVEARRYAPLALANVVTARERIGRPLEPALVADAMTGLVGLVQDRDPYARLHAAKAMGALHDPDANDYLVLLLKDEHAKIRLAAAAALERIGDPRTFPQVVRLFDNVAEDQKFIVRDVLASFAERMQGAPLSPDQVAALGTSPHAWDRWYAEFRARQAKPAPASAPAHAPAPVAPPTAVPPPPPPPAPLPAPRRAGP